jgi:hypothetical protein
MDGRKLQGKHTIFSFVGDDTDASPRVFFLRLFWLLFSGGDGLKKTASCFVGDDSKET